MAQCPYCNGDITETASKCRHCGEWLKRPPATSAPPRLQGGAFAGIASFVVPGLGQLLTGRPRGALGYFVVAIVAWFFLLGWVVHIVSAYDAGVGGSDSIDRLKRLNEFKSPWGD